MVNLKIGYNRKSPRLELLIRFFYGIVLGIILAIWGFVAGILAFIQFIVILVTGERDEWLHKHLDGYFEFLFKSNSYIGLITDERPL